VTGNARKEEEKKFEQKAERILIDTEGNHAEMKPLAMQGLKTPRTNAYTQTFPRNEMTFIQALERVEYST
jgi:hypothetical protein